MPIGTGSKRSVLRGGLAVALVPIAILILAAGRGGAENSPEPSPHPSASPAPSVPDADSVISLLDAVIGWSRGTDFEQSLVSEPSEVLFVSQNRTQASEILKLAFRYARAEANLLASLGVTAPKPAPAPVSSDPFAHPELMQDRRARIKAQVASLQDQIDKLRTQIAAARKAQRAQLTSQLALLQSQLELAQARAGLLDTLVKFGASAAVLQTGRPSGGLTSEIDELEKTLPQSGETAPANSAASASATPPAAAEVSGLIPRAREWFALNRKVGLIGQRVQSTAQLDTAVARSLGGLRTLLVSIDNQASSLAGQAVNEAGASTSTIEARGKQFEDLVGRNKSASEALLPLRELSLLLVRYQTNLHEWQSNVRQRASTQLYGLAISAAGLTLVLGLLLAIGVAWRRIAFRYVEDARRRNQMLQLRNFVIGALIVIVIAFEFVSEAGSLATVIGLGTAGIAVALQDVILSIAGYFRLGGRFGIKVGDWVELQGVRGEVIDIGLTKITMMELGGEGQREPTGRLLVMPNSVVFREKFFNRAYGTSLGWAQLELTIAPDCDYHLAEKLLLQAVEEVFSRYRDAARSGSREMEQRFHLRLEPPRPQSRLRIGSDAIRLSVRYPVDVRMQVQVTDEISRKVLESLMREPSIRLAPNAAAAILRAEPADSGAAPSVAMPMTVSTPAPQAAVSQDVSASAGKP